MSIIMVMSQAGKFSRKKICQKKWILDARGLMMKIEDIRVIRANHPPF